MYILGQVRYTYRYICSRNNEVYVLVIMFVNMHYSDRNWYTIHLSEFLIGHYIKYDSLQYMYI